MVEWDDDIPPWSRLVAEVDRVRQNHARVFSSSEVGHAAVAG
jgi:uncharacterized protein (UPF0276 family)